MKQIKITCKAAQSIPLSCIEILQGDLKELSDDNFKKLKAEILKEGFSFPMFVWPNDGKFYLLDGTHRYKTLKILQQEGYHIPDLPCAIIEADNENHAKRKLLAVTSSYAKITGQGLYEFSLGADIKPDELSERFNFDHEFNFDGFVSEFFSDPEIEHLDEIQDDVPEIKENPITKRGDVWILGDHRLMCGDSTMIDDVEKLMDGQKADAVYTDPPYGMYLNTDFSSMKSEMFKGKTGGADYDQVIGDHEDYDPHHIFATFGDCKEIFLWGADYYAERLIDKNKGSWIVWDKRANGNDNVKEDESSDKMYGSTFELCWSKNKHKRVMARIKFAGIFD